MGKVVAHASQQVPAPAERVRAFLRDYREARPRILPDNYSAYRVEVGGEGAGTVVAYHFAAGRRERDYRLLVEEPEGRLRERDELSSFVSTWTVTPIGTGSKVTVESSWDGAGGVAGAFERFFAPLGLRRIQRDMLSRLVSAVG